MQKQCFKCGKVKPLSDFYRHPAMADGYLNKCKECAKRDSIEHRMANIEYVREYDRNRPNAKDRSKENKRRLNELRETNPEKYRENERIRLKNYRSKNREKNMAHRAVSYSISTGRIKNPGICSICGSSCYTEAHHEDYSKPLDIIWLCDKCHKNRHKEIRAEKRLKVTP